MLGRQIFTAKAKVYDLYISDYENAQILVMANSCVLKLVKGRGQKSEKVNNR